MIRILLVDDQALVRSGFRTILDTENDFQVVGEAATGAEAVALARELTPDVICMDVEMPEMDGITASRTILQRVSGERAPAILILTTFGHDEYLFDALAAGVSGFLLKTSRAEQLTDAIRTLAAGHALLGPDVTATVLQRLRSGADPAEQSVADERQRNTRIAEVNLTEREHEVLERVAQGASNAEIAAALYLGESTIKTHVSNILRKLGARDRIQAVVWAHTHGVTLSDGR